MPQMPCVDFLRNQIIIFRYFSSFYEHETTGCFHEIGSKSEENGLQGCCSCSLSDTLQNFGETGCLSHHVTTH